MTATNETKPTSERKCGAIRKGITGGWARYNGTICERAAGHLLREQGGHKGPTDDGSMLEWVDPEPAVSERKCVQVTVLVPTGRGPCGEVETHWRHANPCDEACFLTMDCRHHPFLYADPEPVAESPSVPRTSREFVNELGNQIRITIEGPSSKSENVLTRREADELSSVLDEHLSYEVPSVPGWTPAANGAYVPNRVQEKSSAPVARCLNCREVRRSAEASRWCSAGTQMKSEHVWSDDAPQPTCKCCGLVGPSAACQARHEDGVCPVCQCETIEGLKRHRELLRQWRAAVQRHKDDVETLRSTIRQHEETITFWRRDAMFCIEQGRRHEATIARLTEHYGKLLSALQSVQERCERRRKNTHGLEQAFAQTILTIVAPLAALLDEVKLEVPSV